MNITNRDILWVSVAGLAFFYFGHFIFGHDNAKTVVDCMVVGCALTVFITWRRAAITALHGGVKTGAENILITVWGTWTVILALFGYIVMYSILKRSSPDTAEWLRLSPVGGTFSTLLDIMGVFAILTPINGSARLPQPRLAEWWFGVIAGAFLAGILTTLALLHYVDLN